MGRKEVTIGVETEDNSEVLAREELKRLTRQLRLMENDKRAYLDESNGAQNYQKNILQYLGEEEKKIQIELSIFTKKFNEERDIEKSHKITNVVMTYKKLATELKKEEKLNFKISKKMNEVLERVEDLKSYVGRKEKEEASIHELKNRIFITKQKLETVTSKFDGVVADNAESRNTIDQALQENLSISQKCSQLEKDVEKGKVTIDDLVDQATSAYDQREEAVMKGNLFLARNLKEKKQNILEMSELNRIIRHEEKLLDFMNIKNKDRLFLETEEERLSRLELSKEKILDLAIESYREHFESLLTSSSTNFLSLVDEYKHLVHTNIQRFSYINQLNKDIEILQMDIVKLRQQIQTSSSQTIERNHVKNKIIISRQATLDELTASFNKMKSTLEILEKVMVEVVFFITNLFQMTEINLKAPVLELLGSNGEISSQNVILYLNILEDRFGDLCTNKKLEKYQLSENEGGSQSIVKSLRPSSKAGSMYSSRQKMNTILQERDSGEEFCYKLVDNELDPLDYRTMREKIIGESTGGTGSSVSGQDSISSSTFLS